MDEQEDLALATLLAVRAEIAPDLDEALLRSCYAIQQKHQYDRVRGASSTAMERLIDAHLDREGAGQ